MTRPCKVMAKRFDVIISVYNHMSVDVMPSHSETGEIADRAVLDTTHESVTLKEACDLAEEIADTHGYVPYGNSVKGWFRHGFLDDIEGVVAYPHVYRTYTNPKKVYYEGDKGSPRTLFIEITKVY